MFAKISKRVIAVTLVAAMAVTTATVANDNTASAKLKKKATVTQGKEVKLTASGSAKWTSSNDQIAHCQKTSGKSIKIWGIKAGKATITATVGSKKETCKVTVKKAKKGTVLYNFANSTDPKNRPPYVRGYDSKGDISGWKYDSFSIWLCQATFYGEKTYISPDYRGRKLSVEMVVKNSGSRDLPELGVCFNYTKGADDAPYPFAYHASREKLASSVKKSKGHKHTTYQIGKKVLKKGKDQKIKFTFTIPKGAQNGDYNSELEGNPQYPIMMYIPNLKDSSPYKPGDEITVKKCVIKLAN